MTKKHALIPVLRIEQRILVLRGQKVILDADLSELERKLQSHDVSIRSLVAAIRELRQLPEPKRRPIGFRLKES